MGVLNLDTITPLEDLSGLVELHLNGNLLQGDPQFPALPKLRTLYLSHNEITGVSGLSTLTGLSALVVDVTTKTRLGAELKELEQRGPRVIAW